MPDVNEVPIKDWMTYEAETNRILDDFHARRGVGELSVSHPLFRGSGRSMLAAGHHTGAVLSQAMVRQELPSASPVRCTRRRFADRKTVGPRSRRCRG